MAGADGTSRIRDVVRDSKILWDTLSRFDRKFEVDVGCQQAERVFPCSQNGEISEIHTRSNKADYVWRRYYDLKDNTLFNQQCLKPVGFTSSFDEIECWFRVYEEKEASFLGVYRKNTESESIIVRFKRNLPVFDGFWHTEDLMDWIAAIEDFFEEIKPPEHLKCTIVWYKMEGAAYYWWKQLQNDRVLGGKDEIVSWPTMRNMLLNRFSPAKCLAKLPNQLNQQENEEKGKHMMVDDFTHYTCLTKVNKQSSSCKNYSSPHEGKVDMEIQALGVVDELRGQSAGMPPMLLLETLDKNGAPCKQTEENISNDHEVRSELEFTKAKTPSIGSEADSVSVKEKLELGCRLGGLETMIPKMLVNVLVKKCISQAVRRGNESCRATKIDDVKDEQSRQQIHLKLKDIDFVIGKILMLNFDPGGIFYFIRTHSFSLSNDLLALLLFRNGIVMLRNRDWKHGVVTRDEAVCRDISCLYKPLDNLVIIMRIDCGTCAPIPIRMGVKYSYLGFHCGYEVWTPFALQSRVNGRLYISGKDPRSAKSIKINVPAPLTIAHLWLQNANKASHVVLGANLVSRLKQIRFNLLLNVKEVYSVNDVFGMLDIYTGGSDIVKKPKTRPMQYTYENGSLSYMKYTSNVGQSLLTKSAPLNVPLFEIFVRPIQRWLGLQHASLLHQKVRETAERHIRNRFLDRTKDGWIVLTTIYHVYCVPGVLEDCIWEWLYWVQARHPFNAHVVEYIIFLKVGVYIVSLKFTMKYFERVRLFHTSTVLLKNKAEGDLTPFDLSSIMSKGKMNIELKVGKFGDWCHSLCVLLGEIFLMACVMKYSFLNLGQGMDCVIGLENMKETAALMFEHEAFSVMGFDFICWFLGLLHMNIVQERLEHYYKLISVTIAPKVVDRMNCTGFVTVEYSNLSHVPKPGQGITIEEQFVKMKMLALSDYIGLLLVLDSRGGLKEMKYITLKMSLGRYQVGKNDVVFGILSQMLQKAVICLSFPGHCGYNFDLTRGQAIPWEGGNDENNVNVERKFIMVDLTRGRAIPWEGGNDENNVNVERKFIMMDLSHIIIDSCVKIWRKNAQTDETLELFHKMVNGLDPPMDLVGKLGSLDGDSCEFTRGRVHYFGEDGDDAVWLSLSICFYVFVVFCFKG